MKLEIPKQHLGLKKIKMDETWNTEATFRTEEDKKKVLDAADSLLGQKWTVFAPKTVLLADFGIIKAIFIPFYESYP